MKCNCWLGILNDYDQSDTNNLYLDGYVETLNQKSKMTIRMNMAFGWKEVKPKDYLDRRKSMATLFTFCPNCGVKINWKVIRNNLDSK